MRRDFPTSSPPYRTLRWKGAGCQTVQPVTPCCSTFYTSTIPLRYCKKHPGCSLPVARRQSSIGAPTSKRRAAHRCQSVPRPSNVESGASKPVWNSYDTNRYAVAPGIGGWSCVGPRGMINERNDRFVGWNSPTRSTLLLGYYSPRAKWPCSIFPFWITIPSFACRRNRLANRRTSRTGTHDLGETGLR